LGLLRRGKKGGKGKDPVLGKAARAERKKKSEVKANLYKHDQINS